MSMTAATNRREFGGGFAFLHPILWHVDLIFMLNDQQRDRPTWTGLLCRDYDDAFCEPCLFTCGCRGSLSACFQIMTSLWVPFS
jgi:hypothetical protein